MSGIREQRIRARAFELWEAQGKPENRDLALWLIAENEIDAGAEPPIESEAIVLRSEPVSPHSADEH
jgi:hypothetical protein